MSQDIFSDFLWHSSIGIDASLRDNKRFVTRIANNPRARKMFVAARDDSQMLIHRTTRALWKLSDDKKFIEPVFDTDVLGENEVREAME